MSGIGSCSRRVVSRCREMAYAGAPMPMDSVQQSRPPALRLFVALWLPVEVCTALQSVQAELRELLPRGSASCQSVSTFQVRSRTPLVIRGEM